MKILVAGGTRYMGRYLVKELLERGHAVTILSRGLAKDSFGDKVRRVHADRYNREELEAVFSKEDYDVVCDSLAYCSNDVDTLLSAVNCKRYVQISSASVYRDWHVNMLESEFLPEKEALFACERSEVTYDVGKRQAECALVQRFGHLSYAMARFPFVLGEDDYTNRLRFYVEHILGRKAFFTENKEAQMAFVHAREAGAFLAHLAESDFCGAVNGANYGTISIADLEEYLGESMILEVGAEEAPYNLEQDYNLNLSGAEAIGFEFTQLKDWFWRLVDTYKQQYERIEKER